jgi:cyclic pyranopterin phosphate synthase
MPEKIEAVPMKEILSYEEILEVAEQAAAIGINRVKITGGEPLVRRGVEQLIGMLKKVPGIEQVTLTTNGVLLEERCKALKAAGIDGINVSLDTTDPVRYRDVTGSDALDAVLR